jgi:hypothetical protein
VNTPQEYREQAAWVLRVGACLVLLLAEAAPSVRRQLAKIVTNLVNQAEKLEAEMVAHQLAEAERQTKDMPRVGKLALLW